MKRFLFLAILLLLSSVTYSQDQTFITLSEIALQGKVQETGFYLNSKNCSNKDNLHIAYDPKKDVLIFGYFYHKTSIIENHTWNRKTGETFTLACKFDENIDAKKAKKISEDQIKDLALKFRSDWLTCK